MRKVAARFNELAAHYSECPLYGSYVDACAQMLTQPSEKWSEVWTLTGK